jgi:hypothetical protein
LSGAAVALLIAAVAAAFWPGIAMYDTVAQYGQVLGGPVDDWHPPVMVRLWQFLHLLAPGTAPMFVLQIGLYGVGLVLIVVALVRAGRPLAALAATLITLSPLLLGWQMVVLKDGQMLGALLAAVGILLYFRLGGRRVPAAAALLAGLLVVYATLLRANALFATVPLAVLLLAHPRSMVARAMLVISGILAVLAVTPLINQRLFGAEPSGVAKTQPLFDLAAMAATSRSPAPFTPAERALIVRRDCAKAFFWDPLGDPLACGSATDRLRSESATSLYLELGRVAAARPLAYAEHRLQHWTSTERWLVPPGLIDAGPPDEAEPNDAGLKSPANPLVPLWQHVAAIEAATPLGWPIFWTAVALLLLAPAWKRRSDPAAGIALALIVSALILEASFLVVSISSDLRYHLWPMAASALGLLLLGNRLRWRGRGALVSGCVLMLVIAAGVAVRHSLPRAPDSYQAMVHSLSG